MGDITSHAEISDFVAEQMKTIVSSQIIPHNDYHYIELGNYMTDVSQFSDPPAFHRAREVARVKATAEAGAFAGAYNVDHWVDNLFGTKSGGNPDGRVGDFFKLLILGITHQLLDPDGFASAHPLVRSPFSAAEVDRVFEANYSQYWPHEHLDFPPVLDLTEIWDRSGFEIAENTQRRLMSYIENYLQYLSEGLSMLEHQWVRAMTGGNASTEERRDFLVRLGHLLHGIEDYFFHSNFVEVRQWQHIKRTYAQFDASTTEGHDRLAVRGLTHRQDSRDVTLRRRFHRRLRYPIFQRDGRTPSGAPEYSAHPTASRNATNFVYTGGFGEKDVYHTFGTAFHALEERIQETQRAQTAYEAANPGQRAPGARALESLRSTDLILVRLIFSEDAREEMLDDDLKDEHQATHQRQVRAGEYDSTIDGLEGDGDLSARAAAVLKRAFALDKRFEDAFPNEKLLGPGGIVIEMIYRTMETQKESALMSSSLDSNWRSITVRSSFNRATAETVGSHSLMSKDTAESHPLRYDSVMLAKHASAGIACELAKRLVSGSPINTGVDWDTILRFFIRFPRVGSQRWEEQIIRQIHQTPSGRRDSISQPNVVDLVDQPNFGLLGPGRNPGKLRDRRSGRTQETLEERYRGFETDPP